MSHPNPAGRLVCNGGCAGAALHVSGSCSIWAAASSISSLSTQGAHHRVHYKPDADTSHAAPPENDAKVQSGSLQPAQ